MITRLVAYGYRCFPRLSVDVGRYHVLAGANGAGQAPLLDLSVLPGDLLRQRRVADAFLQHQDPEAASRARTLTEMIFRERGGSVTLAVEARFAAGLAKPPCSKAALEHLRDRNRADRSKAVFRPLAARTSVKAWIDPAFLKLHGTSRDWFPEDSL